MNIYKRIRGKQRKLKKKTENNRKRVGLGPKIYPPNPNPTYAYYILTLTTSLFPYFYTLLYPTHFTQTNINKQTQK
jgi:hypothetical protein